MAVISVGVYDVKPVGKSDGEMKEIEISVAYVDTCADNGLSIVTLDSGRTGKDTSI